MRLPGIDIPAGSSLEKALAAMFSIEAEGSSIWGKISSAQSVEIIVAPKKPEAAPA
ncbi:MAG: hypothetical protein R3D88_06910 [Alphaproteobacteria bacterium]|nr:hypothetical protein [Alphaproteobacteria bacterium]